MKRLFFPAAVGFVLLAAPPAASSGETGPLVLTLDQTLSLAADQSRVVLQAREYQARVEARYAEERAAALPLFSLSSSVSRSDDASVRNLGPPEETDNLSVTLAVAQPVFTWGQIGAAIRVADIGRASAADRLAGARGTALRDAATAFFDVLLAREFEALAAQNLQQKVRHLAEAKRRLAAGTATDFDVLAADVAAQNARPEVIRATSRVGAARQQLAFVLGVRGREVDVSGSLLAASTAAPDHTAAFATAAANRPELAELRKARAISEELVRIARAGNKPRVDFAADLGWNLVTMYEKTGDGPAWSAGVQMSWPIFDGGRTKGAVARTASEARSSALDEAEFLDALALATRTGVDAVREAAAVVEAIGGTVLEAERLLAMAERGFELGVKLRLDVDDAQLNLLQARAGLARGRRDLLVAQLNLRWVTGELSPGPPPGPPAKP